MLKTAGRKCLDGVYYEATRALVRLSWQNRVCTGWFVGNEGHILTAYHCINQINLNELALHNACHKETCDHAIQPCREVLHIGAQVVAASFSLDYALLLPLNHTHRNGNYLRLFEADTSVLGQRIFIPQLTETMSTVVVASNGKVLTTTYTGCNRLDRLGYDLPTKTCSSGSPIISESTGVVLGMHTCGGIRISYTNLIESLGCDGKVGGMNSGVLARDIVLDLRRLGCLPQYAATTVELEQVAEPTITTEASGTLFQLESHRSTFDTFLITTKEPGRLTIDLLAWTVDDKGHWYDLRQDCDASHFDSKVILAYIDPFDGRLHRLMENDNDTRGNGRMDGSIDVRDSYLDAYLTLPGDYYILVGTSAMSLDSVVGNTTWSSGIYGCGQIKAIQGNYKMTIKYDSVMLSNLELPTNANSNTTCLEPKCPLSSSLNDISLRVEAVVAGTLHRGSLAMDYIAFEMYATGRIAIDVVSYQEYENGTLHPFSDLCGRAYVDTIIYLFQQPHAAATSYLDPSRLVAMADNRSVDSTTSQYYRSISTRDPYLEITLPRGNYTLVVGQQPLTLAQAVHVVNPSLRDPAAPLLCGRPHAFGHYHVFFSTARKGSLGTPRMPGSFNYSACKEEVCVN